MRPRPPRRFEPVVPAFAGWSTYPRSVINLLIFGLTALAGEWLVHQAQYLIEYGSRFGTVLANGPHRYYTVQVGLLVALTAAILVLLVAQTLRSLAFKRRGLAETLSPRLAESVPRQRSHMTARVVAGSAVVLFVMQVAIYASQENVEIASVSGRWPGLAVLFASGHVTVVPLHALAAIGGALLLRAVHACLLRSRRATQVLVLLATIGQSRAGQSQPFLVRGSHVPDLRLEAGSLCLRSPPASAV